MVDSHWDWISNEFSLILKKTKAFIETEVIPLESRLVTESFENIEPQLKELREKVKGMGLWLPQISKEYGGMGKFNGTWIFIRIFG